jgi:hypothetical protein
MKILVSTTQTQGQRESDFCFVPEGEMLMFSFLCDTDREDPNPDAGCGCSRSLGGMICQMSTTTFKVADLDITAQQFVHNYLGALQDAGFLVGSSKQEIADYQNDANEMLKAAAAFKVGTVIELRKTEFGKRALRFSRRNV